MEHDGNGWVQCGKGHRHWGRFGAAGLLLGRIPPSDLSKPGPAEPRALEPGPAEPGAPVAAAPESGAHRTMEVLLQHRAAWTANGGTWGVPGGARDSHESAVQAALREAEEEAGIAAVAVAAFDELIDDHGAGWSYTTVLANLVRPVVLVPQAESEELRWVSVAEVGDLPLHPGFAGTWPVLRDRLPTARGAAARSDQG